MSSEELAKLEAELGSNLNTEGVNINISKGTRLYNDIKRLLRKRHRVSAIKGLALL